MTWRTRLAILLGYLAVGGTSQCIAGVEHNTFEGQTLWLLSSIFVMLCVISTSMSLKRD